MSEQPSPDSVLPLISDEYKGPQEERAARPDLCHKCGRCCTTAITGDSYEEIKAKADAGNDGAKGFLRVFEPFESVEAARLVDAEHVDRVLEELSKSRNLSESEVTFFHCRYVSDHGLCTIYEDRPECCTRAPNNGWSLMPTGCGYEGWQFLQREKQKESVRRLKQMQTFLEIVARKGATFPELQATVDRVLNSVKEASVEWEQYSSASAWRAYSDELS
jgi:Fe-S-cluster containining protein